VLACCGGHVKGVAVNDVRFEDYLRCPSPFLAGFGAEEARKDMQQTRSTFGSVVCEQFDSVDAHQREQRVMPPFELTLAERGLHGGELSAKHGNNEVP